MQSLQRQEAKNRFSEVMDLTLKEGPHLVTRRGEEAVVILSVWDYRRLSGRTTNIAIYGVDPEQPCFQAPTQLL
jgi:antitoxin Phd